jgi:hypothetical protein
MVMHRPANFKYDLEVIWENEKKSQGKCELYLYCIEAAERTQIMGI